MSMQSNVGNRQIYEDGDERKYSAKELKEKQYKGPEPVEDEAAKSRKDPTLPARSHGHEPSKGAKIDAEIKAEEEEELRKKGKA